MVFFISAGSQNCCGAGPRNEEVQGGVGTGPGGAGRGPGGAGTGPGGAGTGPGGAGTGPGGAGTGPGGARLLSDATYIKKTKPTIKHLSATRYSM